MKKNAILKAIVLLGGLWSFSALAVESPKPVIPLFNEYLATNVAGIDLQTDAGIEAIGGNDSVEVLSTSDPDKLKSRLHFKLKAKDSADNSDAGVFDAFVDTLAYPDPDTAVNTNYACEDDGYIVGVDPTLDDYPCDYDVNAGIANDGATRYFVIGLGVYAWYQNAADGQVDIGRVSVTVLNPGSGDTEWRGVWYVTDQNWSLEAGLSAVGDFLYDDGTDEVRIVYSRDLPDGRVEMKYSYFEIATGDPIDEQRFKIGVP